MAVYTMSMWGDDVKFTGVRGFGIFVQKCRRIMHDTFVTPILVASTNIQIMYHIWVIYPLPKMWPVNYSILDMEINDENLMFLFINM